MAYRDFGRSGPRWPPGDGEWEDLMGRLRQFPRSPQKGVLALLVAVLLVWAATGIYIVGPGEQGVVLQFGRVVRTTGSGLNYRIPWPIQQVRVVNIQAIQRLEVGFRSSREEPVAHARWLPSP